MRVLWGESLARVAGLLTGVPDRNNLGIVDISFMRRCEGFWRWFSRARPNIVTIIISFALMAIVNPLRTVPSVHVVQVVGAAASSRNYVLLPAHSDWLPLIGQVVLRRRV